MPRDDFSNSTKEQLARRAGYRCSFPNCGAPSYGKSDEGNSKTTNIGTACHISAASSGKGARRFNPDLTSAQRKHIVNGIWMCRNHGKLIDDDEVRFSVEILKKWKEISEIIAQIMSENNLEYKEALKIANFKNLAPEKISLAGIGTENEIVGNIINDCCVSIAWGKEIAYKSRDFLIEYIRNAFEHGKATEININVIDNKIIVTDNGNKFDAKSLLKNDAKTGGTLSIKELNNEFKSKLILTTKYDKGQNISIISKLNSENDILNITSCSHTLSYNEFRMRNLELIVDETCNEYFFVLPNYISPSDIGHLNDVLYDFSRFEKPITIITKHLSGLVSRLIKEYNSEIKIIEIE